jgi:hypothetical protein
MTFFGAAMRIPATLLLASLSLPAAAQGNEWVTNGSFTGTLTPWVMGGGYSVNPGLDNAWNTTGMGVSDSFGCNPGGQVTPAPYPANTIEQTVIMVSALTYEFRCDASTTQTANPTTTVDVVTVWATVDNVEVARFQFGAGGPIKRTQICGRFTPVNSGPVVLRVHFQRNLLATPTSARVNVDNVSIRDVVGPTFWINSNRRINTTVVCAVRGDAGAAFATFIAAGEQNPGVPIPGIGGLLLLDGTAQMMVLGTLSNSGAGNHNLAVPNLPFLLTTPFWFQAGTALGSSVSLGYHFCVVFTQ